LSRRKALGGKKQRLIRQDAGENLKGKNTKSKPRDHNFLFEMEIQGGDKRGIRRRKTKECCASTALQEKMADQKELGPTSHAQPPCESKSGKRIGANKISLLSEGMGDNCTKAVRSEEHETNSHSRPSRAKRAKAQLAMNTQDTNKKGNEKKKNQQASPSSIISFFQFPQWA